MASLPFHSNLSGRIGPTGVPAFLNVDLFQLEDVREYVTEAMNSVLGKKNKLKLAPMYHPVILTNINVLQMIKEGFPGHYPRSLVWHLNNLNKEPNGDQLFFNIKQMVVYQWIKRNVLK